MAGTAGFGGCGVVCVLDDARVTDTTALEALIDDYLRWEARHRPRIGYPSVSPMFRDAGRSGVWDEAIERLEREVASLQLRAMEGAWRSLQRLEDRALRVDHYNRRLAVAVNRVPGFTGEQTAAIVRTAKVRLAALLSERDVLL